MNLLVNLDVDDLGRAIHYVGVHPDDLPY